VVVVGVDFTVNRSLLALMLGLGDGLILNRRCDLLMHGGVMLA